MPYRYIPCDNFEIYHVFNRSVAHQTIFLQKYDYQRFIDLLDYYRYEKPNIRFSEYNRLSIEAKQECKQRLQTNHAEITKILSFCCMPNHFHLLLRQQSNNGIAIFLSKIQNGYAKYFNLKTKRFGALFQSMFKAIRIETDEQLLHVARYIHLNPLTARVVLTRQELERYPWDSFMSYLEVKNTDLLDKTILMAYYRSIDHLRTHTFDQADYQRLLFVESHLYHDAT